MKKLITALAIISALSISVKAQSLIEEEIKILSKNKWQWMADKDTDKLAKLFDDKSMFVHMGGSWGKNASLRLLNQDSSTIKKQIFTKYFRL